MPLLNIIIDLYHNDTIDPTNGFHLIQQAGIVGIIHKATQGIASVDPEYDERRLRALSVPLLWGSYHFGDGENPVAQADHYLQTINPIATEVMTLDFEPNPSGSTMTFAQADAFVTRIHQETGRYPILYSGQNFLLEQFGEKQAADTVLSKCPLWIAKYDPTPPMSPPAFQDYALWQYTDGALGLQPHSVLGVGRCDRNKFHGTLAELGTLWGSVATEEI